MLCVNADTCAGYQCSVQHRSASPVMYPHGSLWVLEWEGGPQPQRLVALAELAYVKRLSSVMFPSRI